MSNIANRIAELSPEKRKLLARLLKQEQLDISRSVILPRGRDAESFPLSYAQQRLWFINQLEPDSPAYNIPIAQHLRGELNVDALEKSLSEIVRRHETLRTRFTTINGEPVQVITPALPLPLPVIDISHLPPDLRLSHAQHLIDQQAQSPFDLSRAPLCRASLLRLAADEHVLVVTMHHIISDGWSMGVFVRELSQYYEGHGKNSYEREEGLAVQYVDYAIWQREYLQGELLESQLRYWREVLSGDIGVLELPSDRARPARQTYRGAEELLDLDEQTTSTLRRIGQEHGATLFMVLLAAFKVLLYRYTGQTDIVVGMPVAGRNRAELENLIGFFVNTLVVRAEVEGESRYVDLLKRVRERVLGAFAHQDLPFEKIVEELKPERHLNQTPLFNVVFVLQNASEDELKLSGVSHDAFDVETETSKFDLRLAATESGGELLLSLRYSTDLFDAPRMARMLRHYRQVLKGIAANPREHISKLPLLEEHERRELLTCSNTAVDYYASPLCLHQLFERQVEINPQSVALVCEAEQLTYAQLNERANQLANFLRTKGVGAESLVGLCVERSLEMVIGILAILKAGGAYVPLDPDYPRERNAYMLEDARLTLLLTKEPYLANLDAQDIPTVCLDSEWEQVARASRENAPAVTMPESLAYVIYTSGSSGRPKGVQVTHGNVTRLFSATHAWFRFDNRDVWTLFHSYAFDFSVWEMWGALLYGGRLVIVPYLVSRSPEDFYRLLNEQRVTVLNQTPSAFRQLMSVDESNRASSKLNLRAIIFGGEALDLQSLRPWFERHGDERPLLVNMYGITETTVHVTYRPLKSADAVNALGSRIGRPIPDLQLYLLDTNMQPVPVGVAGEIYVGGAGVARNYLGQPDLTAERFVPHPFSEKPGARLYKTGDLARFLDGGDVEYLGRCDQQVKIRGFRIEPGEIEAALAAHPAVRECVVVARETQDGNRTLVAYLVNKPGYAPHVNELRRFLYDKLPEHMVPATFVTIEEMPLTPSGKINRRALPEPEASRPALEREFIAPQTPLEKRLAGMWSAILGIEQIGVEDDFFSLGGDSIKGAVFINRLQEELNEIVHVVTIFNYPTIKQLDAYLVEQYAEAVAKLDAVPGGEATAAGQRSLSAPPVSNNGNSQAERKESLTPSHLESAEPCVDAAKVAQLRALVKPLRLRDTGELAGKNPQAIFVLSAPRSGSTLFRVMLGGHPLLFAPPELELLSYNTLDERRAAFSGGDSFWLEGVIRAVMELKGWDAETAAGFMRELEEKRLSTKSFYLILQELSGDRRLVDKTPSYALNPSVLARAETDFKDALYIHLVRHPYGMIRSFEEARLEQIFFRCEHSFTRRELAELIWLVSNENILGFLHGVPLERQHRVNFEELLEKPEETLRGICRFLKLEFAPDMLLPYKGQKRRMTDGLHAESRMLGDVKFHRHKGIDASAAYRWQQQSGVDALAPDTWQVAGRLGYEIQRIDKDGLPKTRGELRSIRRTAGTTGANFPLSFAQQRLWFIHQLNPESSVYHIPFAIRLKGQLDTIALERSLNAITERHESLRTRFDVIDGEPVQVITPALPLPLPIIDISHLPPDLRLSHAQHLIDQQAQSPFDLSRAPLCRASLLRLAADEHVLVVTMHHIISDGWSMGVFVRELSQYYEGHGRSSYEREEGLAVQYVDYAMWQREYLQGELLESQLRYWREQLKDAPDVLELPTDRPRQPVQTFRGSSQSIEIPRDVSDRLKELSRREGATLFMVLLAAFKVLLYRYTGQTDIVVGVPVAGRNRAELENLIGFFVNTLVVRAEVEGESRYVDLLKRVRERVLGAFAHQDLPFERLVDELRPRRDPGRTPLFQVLFTLQNASQERLQLTGLDVEFMGAEFDTAKFDLTLAVTEEEDGHLSGSIVYNTGLFYSSTIERMARHFEIIVEGIASNPTQRILELPLLTEAELNQQVFEWNDTLVAYPREKCVHELFEAQAARTPEAQALVYEDEQLTYAELNARANKLAHHLRSLGVKPEVAVGILLERSIELIVAHLAILKAGGVYVPLDPQQPSHRIAFMLKDAQAPLLLTVRQLSHLAAGHEVQAIYLDGEQEVIEQQSDENLSSGATAENLAYVMYTSGSTGTPKGVCVPHRAIVRLVLNTNYITFGADDNVLQASNPAFDASTFEIWGALLNGSRLFVVNRDDILSPHKLAGIITTNQISVMFLTTSLFNQLVTESLPTIVPVRNVLFGGEAGNPQHAADALRAGVARLLNVYGPTETTTFATWHQVEESDAEEGSLPIGRPLANTTVYILDRWLQPLPRGAMGELYIGGDGLSRGYLHRPDATAERFVPHPFSGMPGARLYRTGDLARYLHDGKIEYLGRVDNQIKLRGYRIEPGEIETVLCHLSDVREAVVLMRADEDGEKRLVAYVVPQVAAALKPDEISHALKERLPEYMIPSAFVLLDRMPLTSNGKVDRRALLACGDEKFVSESPYEAPRSTLEIQLTNIWEQILKRSPVGIKDNFFELGGHSLLAVKLLARIHKELRRELPLTSLLQAQTVEALAKLLERKRVSASPAPLVAVQPQGSLTPFFCVHPVGGNVLCYTELAQQLGRAQPFYAFQAQGLTAPAEPLTRIEQMAALYVEVMRGVQPRGPYRLGGWSMGGVVAFEMAQQLRLQGEEVDVLTLFDSLAPSCIGEQTELDDDALLEIFAADFKRVAGTQVSLSSDESSAVSFAGIEPEQLRKLFQVFKSNLLAMLSYRPQPFGGRVTLLRAEKRSDSAPVDASNGWGDLATGGLDVYPVPGDHYSMLRKPHAALVAGILRQCFAKTTTTEENGEGINE